jgi:hypothetical protein
MSKKQEEALYNLVAGKPYTKANHIWAPLSRADIVKCHTDKNGSIKSVELTVAGQAFYGSRDLEIWRQSLGL